MRAENLSGFSLRDRNSSRESNRLSESVTKASNNANLLSEDQVFQAITRPYLLYAILTKRRINFNTKKDELVQITKELFPNLIDFLHLFDNEEIRDENIEGKMKEQAQRWRKP